MKISLKRRRGFVRVRPGRILRVAKDHAVSATGLSANADDYENLDGAPRPAPATHPWVYAKPGDLAVEILRKDGKVLGHSYLSGPAIRLNRYTDFQKDWFGAEVKPALLEIPVPTAEPPEAFFTKLVEAMMSAKFGDADVYAFQVRVPRDQVKEAAHSIVGAWDYEPREGGAVSKCHVLGLVEGKGNAVNLHFQPPGEHQDQAATPFQVALVLAACKIN